MSTRRVKVVYVLGTSHSGSTLLTSLLGELDGYFPAAETRLVWHGLERRICGCGRLVTECPVWSPPIHAIKHGMGREAAERIVDLQSRTTRRRHLWRLLHDKERTSQWAIGLQAYAQVMADMYSGLAGITSLEAVVDSSKNACEAMLLLGLEAVEPYVVHLVRDPRAVAYSVTRARRHRAVDGGRDWPSETAVDWIIINYVAEIVRKHYEPGRSQLVRYEDLVARPEDTVAGIARMVSDERGRVPFLPGGTQGGGPRHMVGGNAMRFDRGIPTLRQDVEWLRASSRMNLLQVSALTLPLLFRYGYPLRHPDREQTRSLS